MSSLLMDSSSRKQKDARVDLKTSSDLKDLLRQAASVAGVDLSAFILTAAFERAEAVLENQKRRELSEESWKLLNAVMAEPASPTLALHALMRRKRNGSAKE
jgi:uncharacterized protein (DUF1778 family)